MANRIQANFDDGIIEVELNGDPDRVIRFNSSDPNFVDRFLRFQACAEAIIEKLKAIKGLDETELDDNGQPVEGSEEYQEGTLERLGQEFNAELDKAFGYPVCSVAFGVVNPLAPTRSGKLLYESFLDAMTPVIEKSIEGFGAAREKYTTASKNRAARRAKK